MSQVIDLVANRPDASRVFTIGVGESVSHMLVDGIARTGSGSAEYVSGGERLQPKVMRQLKAALSGNTLSQGISHLNSVVLALEIHV